MTLTQGCGDACGRCHEPRSNAGRSKHILGRNSRSFGQYVDRNLPIFGDLSSADFGRSSALGQVWPGCGPRKSCSGPTSSLKSLQKPHRCQRAGSGAACGERKLPARPASPAPRAPRGRPGRARRPHLALPPRAPRARGGAHRKTCATAQGARESPGGAHGVQEARLGMRFDGV